MFTKLLLVALLASASSMAMADQHVDIEHRLTAEQLRATGLDTLSADQLKLLNSLLRADVAKAVEAAEKSQGELRQSGTPTGASSLIGSPKLPDYKAKK